MGLGRGRGRVALSHHHPADIVDDRLAALVEPLRAHIDDAALPVRVLLEADHLGDGGERVAGKDRLQEPAIGVAEIGDRVERDVGDGLAEHDMEGEQIVDRACGIADGAREGLRALRREARRRSAPNRARRRRWSACAASRAGSSARGENPRRTGRRRSWPRTARASTVRRRWGRRNR